MTESVPTDSDLQHVVTNMVIVVATDGVIHSVLESPDSAESATISELESSNIDVLFPPDISQRLLECVSRTVRTRQCHRDEMEVSDDGRVCEFVFVAQGRDRALLVVRDLSGQSIKLSRIKELAYTDKATGLPNREFLFAELQKITEMQRLREGRAAMICIHVDQPDDHGYSLSPAQQDEVLQEVAFRLKRQLRGSNEPSEEDMERFTMVARTDYRQFGIVLPSIDSGDDAEAVVTRLISSLKQTASIGARSVQLRAYGGIALFPQDGTDATTLFENVVAALEDARNSHEVPYKFHSGTVRLRALQRQDLEVELRTALDQENYALNYLPVVRADSLLPVSFEALLRWPETILGSHSTRKIVSIAERTGLILPIGEWVMRHAFQQLRSLRNKGHDAFRLAINLSVQEFSRNDLTARVERLLDDAGLEPDDLEFEIKEHMLLRDAIAGYAGCNELKRLGVRIVVDNYGTGACSLAHLSQSPVDAIKIDRVFITDIQSSEKDRAASSAAIAVAGELGLDIVAEGVETESQAEVLRDLGCKYLQGFLFSQPLPGSQLPEYLEQMKNVRISGDRQR